MIHFLYGKLCKNKWLVLCLLLGNILLVGIVSATPMYTNATMQRILHRDFEQSGRLNHRPPAMVTLRYEFNQVLPEYRQSVYHQTKNSHVADILQVLDVDAQFTIQTHTMIGWHLAPTDLREDHPLARSMDIVGVGGFYEHITITNGRLPSQHLVNGNTIETIATQATLIRHDLLLGDMLEVRNVYDHDGALYVKIVGIYEWDEQDGEFWAIVDISHIHSLLAHEDVIINNFVENYIPSYRIIARWHQVLHYMDFSAQRVSYYQEMINNLDDRFNRRLLWQFNENFSHIFDAHQERAEQLGITLWILQVPLYVILGFYIYMVSRRIFMMEESDISVLKSRGASRRQILGIYAMQGVFIALCSIPIGIILGFGLCHILGASSGFLQLVQRATLPVSLTPDAFVYAGLAMVFSFITMMAPVIAYSRVTIVEQKQRKRSSTTKRALWQRYFLDFLCLGIASYGLYSFNNQTQPNTNDPIIFLISSLFIIGFGLTVLRIYPYLLKIIYFAGRRFWPPSVYVSLLRIIRSGGEEQFIMIFLIITLAVGTYSARAARTININSEHHIKYIAGADIVFRELWRDNILPQTIMPGSDPPQAAQIVFYEPDFGRFTGFDEVESLTRVKRQNVRVRAGGSDVHNVQLMAIETDLFGRTAWLRNDLLPIHANYFLNILAVNPEGALLSDNFRTEMGYSLSNWITVQDAHGNFTQLEVVGFVERWPGFAPTERTRLDTGEIRETRQHLLVANLGHLQTIWGVFPYQVWMRTNTESNHFFYHFQNAHNLRLLEFTDAKGDVTESRNHPMLQGINGVLTVTFILTLLICFTGFLLYWTLSVRSRAIQFGTFRAMGMTAGNLAGLLVWEQIFVTLTAIIIGAAIGEINARLFVPLVQASYSTDNQAIPLILTSQFSDYVNLYTIIGGMILLSLVILGVYVSRINISQVLRLGED